MPEGAAVTEVIVMGMLRKREGKRPCHKTPAKRKCQMIGHGRKALYEKRRINRRQGARETCGPDNTFG